jgi:hypothetical protein
VQPRYSPANPFRGRDFRVSPRYSAGKPFKPGDYKVNPRYSPSNPFRGKDFKVSPRYSAGNPFRGVNWKVNPRYSRQKNRFIVHKGYKKRTRYYNDTFYYFGDVKRRHKRIGDQHPSSNYHTAMKYNSPKVRNAFRKWNIFWVRMNGNKLSPKGVNNTAGKPKFDKKERVIWNE